MRFELFYALGSLWTGTADPSLRVCLMNPTVSNTAFAAVRSPVQTPPPPVTAFVDVAVVPMDSERVLPNQTVVVEGGRITALGPTMQITVPANARRIDGRGKYLMPGLTDLHTHERVIWEAIGPVGGQSDPGLLTYFMGSGVTAVSASVKSVDVVQRWKGMTARGIPTLRVYFAPGERAKSDSAIIAAKAAGYDFIGVPDLQGAARDSALATARRMGLPIGVHSNGARYDELLALGPYGGAYQHQYVFTNGRGGKVTIPYLKVGSPEWKEKFPAWEEQLPGLAAEVARSGAWLIVTLLCADQSLSSATTAERNTIFKALHDAGVGILLGSDLAFGVTDELEAMISAGLTPYQALLTGTQNIARYFNLLDSSGTVAVGKRADLLLLSGNPLTGVQYVTEPAGVMVDGLWVDRTMLDKSLLGATEWPDRLREVAKKEPMPGWLERLDARVKAVFRGEEAVPEVLDPREETVRALIDSVVEASPSAYRRVQRKLAAALGELRPVVWDRLRHRFAAEVRLWMREEARRDHPVTVPGITSEP